MLGFARFMGSSAQRKKAESALSELKASPDAFVAGNVRWALEPSSRTRRFLNDDIGGGPRFPTARSERKDRERSRSRCPDLIWGPADYHPSSALPSVRLLRGRAGCHASEVDAEYMLPEGRRSIGLGGWEPGQEREVGRVTAPKPRLRSRRILVTPAPLFSRESASVRSSFALCSRSRAKPVKPRHSAAFAFGVKKQRPRTNSRKRGPEEATRVERAPATAVGPSASSVTRNDEARADAAGGCPLRGARRSIHHAARPSPRVATDQERVSADFMARKAGAPGARGRGKPLEQCLQPPAEPRPRRAGDSTVRLAPAGAGVRSRSSRFPRRSSLLVLLLIEHRLVRGDD